MKVIRMTAFHELRVEEAPIPVMDEEEALIRVRYVGVCGSDVHIFEGKHPTAKPPMVLGHEYYGELAELRSGAASGFKRGDVVTGHPLSACGRCEHCLNGFENRCRQLSIFGVHRDGCYAEYVKVPASRLVRMNPGVDPEVAALAEPLAVAVHDVRRSGLRVGESVFIVGAGTIGLLLGVVARFNGARSVVLSESDGQRIKFARSMGFEVVDAADPDFDAKTAAANGGGGYDRVFEASGTQEGCDAMTRVAKSGGTVVLVGIPNQPFRIDYVACVLRELELKGVRIHTFANFRTAVELIDKNLVNAQLKPLVSRVYGFQDAGKAFADIRTDKTIVKALLKFS